MSARYAAPAYYKFTTGEVSSSVETVSTVDWAVYGVPGVLQQAGDRLLVRAGHVVQLSFSPQPPCPLHELQGARHLERSESRQTTMCALSAAHLRFQLKETRPWSRKITVHAYAPKAAQCR